MGLKLLPEIYHDQQPTSIDLIINSTKLTPLDQLSIASFWQIVYLSNHSLFWTTHCREIRFTFITLFVLVHKSITSLPSMRVVSILYTLHFKESSSNVPSSFQKRRFPFVPQAAFVFGEKERTGLQFPDKIFVLISLFNFFRNRMRITGLPWNFTTLAHYFFKWYKQHDDTGELYEYLSWVNNGQFFDCLIFIDIKKYSLIFLTILRPSSIIHYPILRPTSTVNDYWYDSTWRN